MGLVCHFFFFLFFFHRPTSEASWPSAPTINTAKSTSNVMEDPFKVLESTSRHVGSSPEQYADPLEEIGKLSSSRSTKNEGSPPANDGVHDDMDPFDGLGKSIPAFSSERNNRGKDKSPLRTDVNTSWNRTSASKESIEKTSMRSTEIQSQKLPVEIDQESHQNPFGMPTFSTDSRKSFVQTASPPSYMNASSQEANVQADMSPRSEEKSELSDDVWLTVSEIPLFTQPTSAPPPSRPPPPRPVQVSNSKGGLVSPAYTNSRKMVNEYTSFPNSAQHFQGPKSAPAAARDSVASPFDELEDFAMGRSQNNVDESSNGLSSEELGMNSAAAAMKEAMDRAEAKFRHAKEVRERESTKAARSRDAVQPEKDERTMQDERALREKPERLDRERSQREREEEEKEQKRLEKERERDRELEREREEREKEQRRIEKERERAREIEREREKARHAVERATREARGRAAADARTRAEKAAVDKANAEARERAGRAAVQRVQAEARERAAAEAKEKAEKAATEARERTNAVARAEADARTRLERAAVERAAAEARERAAADARERAAAARMNQQKNENDLESFFSSGRASSVPRPRTNSSVRT